MLRRKVVLAISASIVCRPLLSFSQQKTPKLARIGYLAGGGAATFPVSIEPFRLGMRELGYAEGRDFVLEIRSADGKAERLPALAAELARLKVDVIVVTNTPGGVAAQQATTTIPIVMSQSSDPVGSGLVKTLAMPGGNVTGLSNISAELGEKQLEILRALFPKLSRVAVLENPNNPAAVLTTKSVRSAAKTLGVRVFPFGAKNSVEIESAFAAMTRERAEAVIVVLDTFFVQQRRQIIELAATRRVLTVFSEAVSVEAGGLMSYGPNLKDGFRRAATYVDKILKGARPGDMPVEQPTIFELWINQKTAKALGLTIPRELLFRADKVIE